MDGRQRVLSFFFFPLVNTMQLGTVSYPVFKRSVNYSQEVERNDFVLGGFRSVSGFFGGQVNSDLRERK